MTSSAVACHSSPKRPTSTLVPFVIKMSDEHSEWMRRGFHILLVVSSKSSLSGAESIWKLFLGGWHYFGIPAPLLCSLPFRWHTAPSLPPNQWQSASKVCGIGSTGFHTKITTKKPLVTFGWCSVVKRSYSQNKLITRHNIYLEAHRCPSAAEFPHYDYRHAYRSSRKGVGREISQGFWALVLLYVVSPPLSIMA